MLNVLKQVSKYSTLIRSSSIDQASKQLPINKPLSYQLQSGNQIRYVTLGRPAKMSARALVIVAEGTEEMEAVGFFPIRLDASLASQLTRDS